MADVNYTMHNLHNDQFINDNDEVIDEDKKLNDLEEVR